MKISFHGEDIRPSPPDSALFHVIPAPFERTVSYGGGAALGPEALIEASSQLEVFDGISCPGLCGLFTAPPVPCDAETAVVLGAIRDQVTFALSHSAIPVVLGGEHTVTLGSIDALEKTNTSFGVIQFDAHADLRDTYQGSPFSHACVMRRIVERNIPCLQIGVRSLSFEEHQLRQSLGIPYYDAKDVHKQGLGSFALPDDFPENIYITFDVDGLDPSVLSATGTPVPGGLTWTQAMDFLEYITSRRLCIGFDVVELAPMADHHASSFTASQLVYNIMGMLSRNPRFHVRNPAALRGLCV